MFSFFSRSKLELNESNPSEPQRSPTPATGPVTGTVDNSPPNTPSPPPERSASVEIDALHTLISGVPAKIVRQYILERLKDSDPTAEDTSYTADRDTLVRLAEFFKDLTPPKLLHCVRCHSNYFAVENTDRSCRVAHDDASAEVSRAESFKGYSYETLWQCCGKTVEGDGDMGPPDGWCYEGTHTFDHRRARFRADATAADDKLVSCEKMRCAQRGNTTRRRPARKRARVVSHHGPQDDDDDDDEGIKEDTDEDDRQSVSTKSKATAVSGRKRRKLSAEPESASAPVRSTNSMDIDNASVASSPRSRPIKATPAKPRSVSGGQRRSRAGGATAPPVPPIPDSVSTPPAPPKGILKGHVITSSVSSPFPVAASGEEAEAEDTEPPPTKKKRSPRKSITAVENILAEEEKKKRRRKRPGADADEAAYKDVPPASADEQEDHEIVEEKKKKKRKPRKSAGSSQVVDPPEEDDMDVDPDPASHTSARKTRPSRKKNTAPSDTESDEGDSHQPTKPNHKTRRRLLEVVQSSIPGERGCGPSA